jgi:hypothetical protein
MPGDLVCHDAFVIHRSSANTTHDRQRRSLGDPLHLILNPLDPCAGSKPIELRSESPMEVRWT